MTEKYFKECKKSKASHVLKGESFSAIEKKKIVNLKPLVGSDILFEFSDDGMSWREGYLYDIKNEDYNYPYGSGYKWNGKIVYSKVRYKKIRFQSDRKYVWCEDDPILQGENGHLKRDLGVIFNLGFRLEIEKPEGYRRNIVWYQHSGLAETHRYGWE